MGVMDGWDVALLVFAGFMAVLALVRLMIRRRDQLIERFQEEVNAERERRREAAKNEQRQQVMRRSA